MNLLGMTPVVRVEEKLEKKFRPFLKNLSKSTKVRDVVLQTIANGGQDRAALRPSLSAPNIIISSLLSSEKEEALDWIPKIEPNQRVHLKRVFGRKPPIGIKRTELYGWINSWMQFVLFLPGVADLFSFVPRQFEVFRAFADRYFFDQEENFSISWASSTPLARCLLREIPYPIFKDPNLYEILLSFFSAIFSQIPATSLNSFLREGEILHPEHHLVWDPKKSRSIEEEVLKKIQKRPPGVIVSIQRSDLANANFSRRQFFSRSDSIWYDLDLFVEDRSDERSCSVFVTYVKVNGAWYQCDDERITSVRSTMLHLALHRAVLFHFKRTILGNG